MNAARPPGSSSLSVGAHANKPRLEHVHHHVGHGMYEFETHSAFIIVDCFELSSEKAQPRQSTRKRAA